MTILNSYIVGQPQTVIAILVGALGLIICTICIVGSIKENDTFIAAISIPIVMICGFFIVLLLQDNTRPRIEALLDDTTSFVQLNDTYEYVEQRGSIYVFDVRKGTEEYDRLMEQLKEQK